MPLILQISESDVRYVMKILCQASPVLIVNRCIGVFQSPLLEGSEGACVTFTNIT